MEDISLARLERIARNIITDRLRMERVEGDFGIIYLAHGTNADGNIVGLWGYRDKARDIEFKEDTSLDDVRQVLINDASGLMELLDEKGLV